MELAKSKASKTLEHLEQRQWIRSVMELDNPELRALLEYVEGCWTNWGVLDRECLDPAGLVRWWPHLMLVDVIADQSDIRFRVIGTWIVDRIGRDDTGRTMGEIGLTPFRKTVLDAYLDCVVLQTPLCSKGVFYDRSNSVRALGAERLLIPIHDAARDRWQVLAAIYFDDSAAN